MSKSKWKIVLPFMSKITLIVHDGAEALAGITYAGRCGWVAITCTNYSGEVGCTCMWVPDVHVCMLPNGNIPPG